jgi:hypothetical protein
MVTPEINTAPTEELTYCAVHPDRETALRCNKCGRYMCVECAVRSPVGYRCRECARGIEDKFFTAAPNDYLIVASVCAVLAGVGGAIVSLINIGLLFTIILGLPVGGGIAEVALRAIQRRRGRQSAIIAAAATVLGGLAGALILMFINFPNAPLNAIFTRAISNISLLIFVGLIAFAVYGRFKMRM